MARMRKTPRPKKPTYERIDRKADSRNVYPILDAVRRNHPELEEATIALAWRYGLKQNKDGQLTLGKCKKVGELDKQFQGHDFVIILNFEAWEILTPEQREALVDHELCHAAISTDPNGNPKKDARGRQMFRIRKHDIEEFGAVIARHGCYKADLENFVATAMRSKKPPQPTLLDGFDEAGNAEGKGEAAVAEPATEKESHVEKLAKDRPAPKKANKGKDKKAA